MSSNPSVDIYNTPAGLPPHGETSNLSKPPQLHIIYLTTMVLCLSTATMAVALRVFTKYHIMKQVRAEDYALVVVQLGFIPWIALLIALPGQGMHIWDISINDYMRFAKYQNYILILYGPLVFGVKLSVLLQLQHIFVTGRRQLAFLVIQAMIWANLAYYLAYMFLDIFACVPRHKIWDASVPGKCFSVEVLFIAPAGINILSNLLILALPVILVFQLQMTLRKKLAIITVFGSGSFVVVSSVLHLYYAVKLSQTTDIVLSVNPVGMWAAAEIALTILTATLPTMPRLWSYTRTGDRGIKKRIGSEIPLCKRTQPTVRGGSSLAEDFIPLRGQCEDLEDGKRGCRRQDLEMQILKTDSYEVTSQARE